MANNIAGNHSSDSRNRKTGKLSVILLGILAIVGLYAIYHNHFDNPFELDDAHTIVNNTAIRELDLPRFFKDATTFSTLPANQSYRPGLTTINALDYKIWSKSQDESPKPIWFHTSTFIFYTLLCVSLYFFYLYFLSYALPEHSWNSYFALFGAVFFGFHTANAETVNYIIQRAEIYSTLGVVMAFLLFIYFKRRKLHLFLLPVIFGVLFKEPAIMFALLLFFFIFLFEENGSLRFADLFSRKLRSSLYYSFTAIIFGLILYAVIKNHTPETWSTGSENGSRIHYLLTNFYSVMHYVFNFILPFNLSVDTDLVIFKNIFDDRVIAGGILILCMLAGAYYFSLRTETRPAAFGILWFFITLIPTSTVIPFSEPLNDHRPFFGYIGLVLVVVNLFAVFVSKRNEFPLVKKIPLAAFTILPLLLISLYGYGTYKRNEVWGKEETLWKDATEKCPQSGRIWMNYGLTLMQRGEYTGALNAYNQAKIYSPYYAYLYINFGILKNAMGKTAEAEADFLSGISYGPQIPDGYKYYGDYLLSHNRDKQADSICRIGLKFSPQNAGLLDLQQRIRNHTPPELVTVGGMKQKVKSNPTPDNWINLSLAYYNSGDYRGCITAAEEALKIDPRNAPAYNNICAAYNILQEWEKAAEAGKKGLEIQPDNQLLRNNLSVSLERLK